MRAKFSTPTTHTTSRHFLLPEISRILAIWAYSMISPFAITGIETASTISLNRSQWPGSRGRSSLYRQCTAKALIPVASIILTNFRVLSRSGKILILHVTGNPQLSTKFFRIYYWKKEGGVGLDVQFFFMLKGFFMDSFFCQMRCW